MNKNLGKTISLFYFVSGVNSILSLYLADSDDEDRKDEDSQGHPGHVGLEAPSLSKVSPTFIHSWSHFGTREDENLVGEEMCGARDLRVCVFKVRWRKMPSHL